MKEAETKIFPWDREEYGISVNWERYGNKNVEERWARTRVRQIRCLGLLKFFILGISHPSAAYSFSLLLLQEVQWRAEHEAGSSLLTVAVQWPTVLANSQVQKKGLIQHHRPLRVTPLTYLLPFQAPSLNPLMILTSPKS